MILRFASLLRRGGFVVPKRSLSQASHPQQWRARLPLPRFRRIRWLLGTVLAGFACHELWSCWTYDQELQKQIQLSRVANQNGELVLDPWQVAALRKLPTRVLSRAWGWLAACELPIWLRGPVIGLYARAFDCDLNAMTACSLVEFRSLADFFTRTLDMNQRPMDPSIMVSPADGHIVYLGPVEGDRVEQVKGLTYSLKGFLGSNVADFEASSRAHEQSRAGLYQITIYLGPGDYHRFHSPVSFRISERRHFPGDLLPVRPELVRILDGLFNFNERCVVAGDWPHGFFALTAVGAYNVGSIRLNFDPELKTNSPCSYLEGAYFQRAFPEKITAAKGAELGRFEMGSTVVLLFEAPDDFVFAVKPGDAVQVGQALGQIVRNIRRETESSSQHNITYFSPLEEIAQLHRVDQ